MLRIKLIKLLCGLKKKRNYLVIVQCIKPRTWLINKRNWNCSLMSINLTCLVLLRNLGGKGHLTGMAKLMVISYLRRTELQKRRGSSLTNPLQMVWSTSLQEKVQSGCSLLSTAGSRIAGGSRMTGSSHPSKISTGKTLCGHKILTQVTLSSSQQETAGMVLPNPQPSCLLRSGTRGCWKGLEIPDPVISLDYEGSRLQ